MREDTYKASLSGPGFDVSFDSYVDAEDVNGWAYQESAIASIVAYCLCASEDHICHMSHILAKIVLHVSEKDEPFPPLAEAEQAFHDAAKKLDAAWKTYPEEE